MKANKDTIAEGPFPKIQVRGPAVYGTFVPIGRSDSEGNVGMEHMKMHSLGDRFCRHVFQGPLRY